MYSIKAKKYMTTNLYEFKLSKRERLRIQDKREEEAKRNIQWEKIEEKTCVG